MSKVINHWFKYHSGDMEFTFRYASPLAEGIAHRLFRVYHRRDKDIPSDDQSLAKLARVSLADYRQVRHELEDIIDLSGPIIRIHIIDQLLEYAIRVSERRSKAGKKGAAVRWHSKNPENGGMASE